MDKNKFEKLKKIDNNIEKLDFFINKLEIKIIKIRKTKFSLIKKRIFDEYEYIPSKEINDKIINLLKEELELMKKERGF